MRRITYGSGAVITTNDVAAALTRLCVAVATVKATDVVSIPIVTGPHGETGTADLIIGTAIPIMTEPAAWHGDEPDFSTGTTLLQMHRDYPHPHGHTAMPVTREYAEQASWDPDLDGY